MGKQNMIPATKNSMSGGTEKGINLPQKNMRALTEGGKELTYPDLVGGYELGFSLCKTDDSIYLSDTGIASKITIPREPIPEEKFPECKEDEEIGYFHTHPKVKDYEPELWKGDYKWGAEHDENIMCLGSGTDEEAVVICYHASDGDLGRARKGEVENPYTEISKRKYD